MLNDYVLQEHNINLLAFYLIRKLMIFNLSIPRWT